MTDALDATLEAEPFRRAQAYASVGVPPSVSPCLRGYHRGMKVLVLRGGPDRERPVSLMSGANVAEALRASGHDVREADVGPDDLAALDAFAEWGGEAVFPVLHGKWGEGGPLQQALETRGLRYVGSGPEAARRCMDKADTKRRFDAAGVPTPAWGVVRPGDPLPVEPPVVVKALDEGSSFAMAICPDAAAADAARRELAPHGPLLVERFITGRELTVAVVAPDVLTAAGEGRGLDADIDANGDADADGDADAPVALPTIEIVPAEGFYDFDAKYHRNDTRYVFDSDPSASARRRLDALAVRAFTELGVRDLARVDFMLDGDGEPWALEVNTMPGFTGHSLLPMAAARAGVQLPTLCDRLVRRAAGR